MTIEGSGPPAVIHATHQKAGSQWILGVLATAAPDRFFQVDPLHTNMTRDLVERGAVMSSVYLDPVEVEARLGSLTHVRPFFVMRDLRDTLVSLYFYTRFSYEPGHPEVDREMLPRREKIEGLDEAEGLLVLIDDLIPVFARRQALWLETESLVIRFEDLVSDPETGFARIFAHAGIDMTPGARSRLLAHHSFEQKAGRRRGDEDVTAHYRKGVVGDWRRHFTPELVEKFKADYGSHLIRTGYETGLDWSIDQPLPAPSPWSHSEAADHSMALP